MLGRPVCFAVIAGPKFFRADVVPSQPAAKLRGAGKENDVVRQSHFAYPRRKSSAEIGRAANPAGCEIRSNHNDGGKPLRDQSFVSGEDGKPKTCPIGNHILQGGNRGGLQSMRQLHFLRLFAHHDKENATEQDPGCDQHLAIGQALLHDKGQHRDQGSESKPDEACLAERPRHRGEGCRFAGKSTTSNPSR